MSPARRRRAPGPARRRRAAGPAAAVVLAAVVAAGCGSSSTPSSNGATATTATTPVSSGALGSACTPSALHTHTAGVLTFAADQPVYAPWYENNDPTNGKGFEDAVAYAVAGELGYSHAQVHWTRVTFDNAIQPGPKSFDADLDEFSITAQREQAFDFSTPYYTVHQAIVGLDSTAKVTTLAQVAQLQLGAQVGTTSYTAIVDQIKPTRAPRVYNSNQDAEQALQSGQIQGLVTDLPTAFEITTGEVQGTRILGQLAAPTGQPEQFGILMVKQSPITSCVDKAVQAITADGTLARIDRQWLSGVGSAPVLASR